jgi:hypothetical protein
MPQHQLIRHHFPVAVPVAQAVNHVAPSGVPHHPIPLDPRLDPFKMGGAVHDMHRHVLQVDGAVERFGGSTTRQ